MYSISGVNALLKRPGFVNKKPKYIPGKADRQAREVFLEEYGKLRKNMENDVVLFADSCHSVRNSVSNYLDTQGRELELKANTGRQRLNINGGYDMNHYE